MSLEEWARNDWLRPYVATPQEVAQLLAVAARDLEQSQQQATEDWKLIIAYNAALKSATAALVASGYRTIKGNRDHEMAIASLVHTVGADSKMVRLIQDLRTKRNIAAYDRVGTVSAQEAAKMFEIAEALRRRVIAWLLTNHPELMKE